MENIDSDAWRAMIGIIYNGDYQTFLHTIYRSSGPCGFREEDFFLDFPIVSVWELSVAMKTTYLIQSAPNLIQSIPQANNGSIIDQDRSTSFRNILL